MSYRFDGRELRRIRVAAELRRERLAADAGVSFDSIRDYEGGRCVPRGTTVARLADVLGCSPGDLFTENGPDATTRLINQRAEQGLATVPTDAEADDAVELLGRAST